MLDPHRSRRSFLSGCTSILASIGLFSSVPAQAKTTNISLVGKKLPAWSPGTLDIHHIATGSGNAAFFILPDATSMLVDAGAIYDRDRFAIAPRPSAARRPGEWIGRYVRRHLRPTGRKDLDYFLLSHLHRDHMGESVPGLPRSRHGDYALTGVADVAELVRTRRFIDRAFPSYDYPAPLAGASNDNYIAFIRAQQRMGATVERFSAGSNSQIHLVNQPSKYPSFEVRNLYANGDLWTGEGDGTRHIFPESAQPKPGKPIDQLPTENECSVAIRLRYGQFSYFTGGDLSNNTNFGADPWRDVEKPVAIACGHVDVAVANHHAYVDSLGPESVTALSPSSFIMMTWDSAHPSIPALFNMLSKRLYPGPREVFATAVKPENEVATRDIAKMASHSGHVVVRVAPGGDEYRIFVLDSFSESDRVLSEHGPFPCG